MHSFKLTTILLPLLLLLAVVLAEKNDNSCESRSHAVNGKERFKKLRHHSKHKNAAHKKQHHKQKKHKTGHKTTKNSESTNTSNDDNSGSMSSDDSSVLSQHNTKRGSLNVPSLKWDTTLASYAHSYASKCQFTHSHGPYGENLSIGGPFDSYSAEKLFMGWWKEGEMCNYSTSKNAGCTMTNGAGHYVNIINEQYTKLGCATVKCPASTMGGNTQGIADTKYLVCEYQ
ncbi:unnamed protein product [Sympodiomycopsis kandeliae]